MGVIAHTYTRKKKKEKEKERKKKRKRLGERAIMAAAMV
jgi:hypothetical protein